MIQHEDGTGRDDAVSFGSVEDADAYFALRGIAEWAPDAVAKEVALVKATDWISANFEGEWTGVPTFVVQALAWPRSGLINPNTGYEYDIGYMPKQLLAATFELAKQSLTTPLYSSANAATPQVIERTIGPITTKYNPLNPNDIVREQNFQFVRDLLRPLLGARSGGFLLTLARA